MKTTSSCNVVLFDLDGTLTDPAEGITKSVRHALNAFGIEVPDLRELNRFIGPPLADSFRDFYGMNPAQCREAIRVMREYFSERGIFENRPYDGIRELLERLRGEGMRLMVATSKPTVFARRILDHFDLARFFEFTGGAELSGERQAKCEVIRYVLEQTGLRPSEEIVMVGDRRHDVEGAHAAGLGCIGVLYGYGDREELERAGAERVVADLGELERAIREWSR